MKINVNPKLNSNIEFWDILELFEKYGYIQHEGNNFQLMLEMSLLIGCKSQKDKKRIQKIIDVNSLNLKANSRSLDSISINSTTE
jgi:hypothetical protein